MIKLKAHGRGASKYTCSIQKSTFREAKGKGNNNLPPKPRLKLKRPRENKVPPEDSLVTYQAGCCDPNIAEAHLTIQKDEKRHLLTTAVISHPPYPHPHRLPSDPL